ncbi:MAG: outer membrane lipoprotein-sorting protein [Congregibacter sp.]
MAPDNPALIYKDLVKERFGLSDPILIAVVAEGELGVYRPDVLAYIDELTELVKSTSNIDPDSVISLATKSTITGSASGIEVIPLLEVRPDTLPAAQSLRERVEDFPLFVGNLVGSNGKAAMIAAYLLDEAKAQQGYAKLKQLVTNQTPPAGVTTHIAGEAAIAGYLGDYIEADARKLNPIAGVIIVLTIIVSFRRLAPAILATFVILGSVSAALGGMALAGIPFYVITNALPVILIGISVADAIHVLNHFYDAQVDNPRVPREEQVVATMEAMWLPVTVTSITTAAGFLGLYFAAHMPPFKFFGLFAALGVVAAWLYSMVALPALMVLCKVQVAQRFIDRRRRGESGVLSLALKRVGQLTLAFPRSVIGAYMLVIAVGIWAASLQTVDADRIELFHVDEPIVAADRAINKHLNGTNTLDIIIETPGPEGIFDTAVLQAMDRLQSFALSLPGVNGATSIVDYLKQMNRVLGSGDQSDYRLPGSQNEVAQYLFLYTFAADPDDFAQEVDYDYQTANIRLIMNHGSYQSIKSVYEPLKHYIEEHFEGSVTATLSGRGSLNYHWVRNIGDAHFKGLAFALLLVFFGASLGFRSLIAGGYTLVPVITAVLFVYAFMVAKGLTLGVGTSMFAAVAVGLGVDFAIHALSHLCGVQAASLSRCSERELVPVDRQRGGEEMSMVQSRKDTVSLDAEANDQQLNQFGRFYGSTAKALLLNVLVVACGFGVLIVSRVAQLRDFGSIVMLSMAAAFIASITLLPALVCVFRPLFMTRSIGSRCSSQLFCLLIILGIGALVFAPEYSIAEEKLSASQVVTRVNALHQGERVTRRLLFRTTDKKGRTRERNTVSFRRFFGKERRQALFFTEPANIRDTAVLTWDYPETTDDEQWLYLPALRKVRRIPAADRGDYFLGTDFSFEDMKLDGQLSTVDYEYELLATSEDGLYRLAALPRSQAIAKELGYSRSEVIVDDSTWVVVKADFWDLRGKHLKTLVVSEVREVNGIMTRHRLLMRNHKTGHRTELLVSDVDYESPIDEAVFTQQALKRGL